MGSSHLRAVLICWLLTAIFAFTSWTAVSGISYTPDEPGHTIDGYFMLFHQDLRFWCNNPPLWEYWIALAGNSEAIPFDPAWPEYRIVVPTPPPPFWSHRV